MEKTVFTPKYTMMMVQEMERLTGRPITMNQRIELQQLLLMWYFQVTTKEERNA